MMKNLIKTAVAGIGVMAGSLLLAQPASAASFTWNVGDGQVVYNDSTDQICAQAFNTEGPRWVEVQLAPVNGGGPSYTWKDYNNSYGNPGSTCRSLATAYEDTQYRATVRTYWGERGTTVSRGSRTFYS
ncbi:hypothetical protein [Bailinhaonella thermotolerans]|uniref:Secreted protein n=1 Tax=Bailinhaonella thermotolerans TaxID=1070861 RepID=A0A3A4ARX4_9ACTN|nr:hypothetical protein [Bailinhaonella thermotolerans]RJL31349.1 hypothetical protein D5H75_20110 [Bailinhaonella thermotolerans]